MKKLTKHKGAYVVSMAAGMLSLLISTAVIADSDNCTGITFTDGIMCKSCCKASGLSFSSCDTVHKGPRCTCACTGSSDTGG